MNKKTRNIIVLIAMYLLPGTQGWVNTVINSLANHFTNVDITTIRSVSSITSLAGLFAGLIAGAVAGKKVSYKTILVTSMTCIFVGGVLPMVLNNFYLILATRVLSGIGFGLLNTRNGIMRHMFGETDASKYLGYGYMITNIASVIGFPIVGMLTEISWRTSFVVYFIALIAIILTILFFVNPEIKEAAPADGGAELKPTEKEKMNPRVYLYAILMALTTMWTYPIMSGMSTLVAYRQVGSAVIAGSINSFYTGGIVIISALFGYLTSKFNRQFFSMGSIVVALGYGLVLFVSNPWVMAIGAMFVGIGFGGVMNYLINAGGASASTSTKTFAATLTTAGMSIGVFFSPYWINLTYKIGALFSNFQNDVERCYLVGLVIFAALFVFGLLVDLRPIKTEKSK